MSKCIEIVHHKRSAGQPTCPCSNDALPGLDYCAAHDPDRVRARQRKQMEVYTRMSALEKAVRMYEAALLECAAAVRLWSKQDGSLACRSALRDAAASLGRAESFVGQARMAIFASGDRVPLHQRRLMTKPDIDRPNRL
jgi:hypothetical protein